MNLTDSKINWLSQFYDKDKITQLSDSQLEILYQHSQPQLVCIKDLENVSVNQYKISSPDGYVSAHLWRNKGVKPCVKIATDSLEISASEDHFFEMANGKWKYAAYIRPGEQVKTQTGVESVKSVTPIGDHEVFDFYIDHENHRYYTNGFSSHNSGAGKSLFLANLGVNYALAGLNVVYLTLELSEELVSMRIDSMITGISTREVFKQIDEVEMQVKITGKKSGNLQVKYMPSGRTVNDVRAYLKEYEVKTGRKCDVLLVDYLDLLMPAGQKISAENLFIKDKYVSEELRNLAMEKNCVFVTAAQLNRGAVEEVEFDHSHISGGLSKIQTADNVFGIFTSRAMRERGKYQIQLMKTRSSSGVGQKIDLDFNVDTLRITNSSDDDTATETHTTKSSSILSSLQRQSVTSNLADTVKTPRAEIGSSKLRQLLNTLPEDL
jgi:hypothetical protein